MKNSIKAWHGLTICLLLVVAVHFTVITSKKNYYQNFEIKGFVSPCSKDCFPFSVRTVYESSQIEVSSLETDYGGILVAQICEDMIESVQCTDLDISKIPDYDTVSRPNTSQTFPRYTYINRYVDSESNKKIYFLYRILRTELDKSKSVYDDPLAIISFNTVTKEITKEGELGAVGLNVKEMHISPDGSYLLIVDSSNPRYLQPTTTSEIVFFDLKNKKTKPFTKVDQGGSLKFLAWIDHNHFFYEEYKYGDGRNVTYRIGAIN